MMKNSRILVIILAIVVAVAAFFVGTKYKHMNTATDTTNSTQVGAVQRPNNQGQNARFGRGRGNFGGVTTGEIVSADANSITVKLPDGSSKIINLTGSTTYTKTDKAAASDLKAGEKIAVFGAGNSDGSITATDIQLNPQLMVRKGTTPTPAK